ncbi:MAG: DUF429 domain-containing protein [Rhodospirillales bacterium]|nr:DUF429 domain-containing protein [Rhodospirillales bacterium]QQS11990.1 MAG: DUF429 domain-containing protein [Rhodospirillales bacterium]
MWVAGVDGCRAGWIAVFRDLDRGGWSFRFAAALEAILHAPECPAIVAVDMPMGFADVAERGGRHGEREARALLAGKSSSVFATPCRAALACDDYRDALAGNRASGPHGVGLSKQAFNLFPKMREVDALVRGSKDARARLREAHPELAFARMNNGAPVLAGKRTAEGARRRATLLARQGYSGATARWEAFRRDAGLRRADAALDDALDAAAVCRTAELIHAGDATRLPADIRRDSHGIEMAIWY